MEKQPFIKKCMHIYNDIMYIFMTLEFPTHNYIYTYIHIYIYTYIVLQ